MMHSLYFLSLASEAPTSDADFWYMVAASTTAALILLVCWVVKRLIEQVSKLVERVDTLEKNAIKRDASIEAQIGKLTGRLESMERLFTSKHE